MADHDDVAHDDAAIERDIRARIDASAFHSSLGISVESATEGAVTLRFEATPAHANLHGTMHGGVIATLADTAAGLAVRSAMADPGGAHASVHLDVQYLAPAGTGTLRATGNVVKLGGRLAFTEATVTDEAGEVLARAQVTVALSRPTTPGDRTPQ
jgi:uncharacterized protein (TIGR00369 family)